MYHVYNSCIFFEIITMSLRILLSILLAAGSVASEFLPFRIAEQDAWLEQQHPEYRNLFNASLSHGCLKHATPDKCPLGNGWSNQTLKHPSNATLNLCYWRPPLDDLNSVIVRVHTYSDMYNDTDFNSTRCPHRWLEIGRFEGSYFYENFTESFENFGMRVFDNDDIDSLYYEDSITLLCRLPHRHKSCNYTARTIDDMNNESTVCEDGESAVAVGMHSDYNYTLVCEACDNALQYDMGKCTANNSTDECLLFQLAGPSTCKSCPLHPPPRPHPPPRSPRPRRRPHPPPRPRRRPPSSTLPHRVPQRALTTLGVNYDQFSNILSMIGGPEQSNTIWWLDSKKKSVFGYCQDIGDGRGLTVGIAGFTGNSLKKIVGIAKGNSTCEWIRKHGNDPDFIDAQWKVYIDEFMTLVPKYYPKFKGYTAKIPLIVGILLDTAMNAGEFSEGNAWGVHELAGHVRQDSPKAWAIDFLNLRHDHFTTGNDKTMCERRIESWKKLVMGKHWDMEIETNKFAYIP